MDYLKLSKEVSYALRHAPWEYELELDNEGWVDIAQLLSAFTENKEWQELKENDLHVMIQKSDKKRHEILNGKIRALYGHSIPQTIKKEITEPPEILYHGTARRFIESIRKNGLLPQKRQYVHLSEDTETALQVGKRRDNEPIILKVRAFEAYKSGIQFYIGNDKVWVAEAIPSEYIDFN
jgi:putative RNA 2'-phosphotransferase